MTKIAKAIDQSVGIGIAIGSALRLLDIDGEFVLLIASQIRVAHEVQLV